MVIDKPGARLTQISQRESDREANSEERGTAPNSFNAVFGARLGARVFSQAFVQQLGLRAAPRHRSLPHSGELASRSTQCHNFSSDCEETRPAIRGKT
jgi:hypothetical protein